MQFALKIFFLLLLFGIFSQLSAESKSEAVLEKPLVERYILDELKELRIENMKLKTELERRVARVEVEQTDRAARYMTDAIGNIFYLIAAATSVLFFAGWNSLRDIRSKTESLVEERVTKITEKYNTQMQTLQDAMTLQSKKVLDNQNKIYNTQYVHSLWMRANLETNPQSKIELYDEILKINDKDAEVYAYKADAVLDMDEYEWALNLSNKALEIDPEYGYAYWQRSCANAQLNNKSQAVADLAVAIEKSPNLKEDIKKEKFFESLKELAAFEHLVT